MVWVMIIWALSMGCRKTATNNSVHYSMNRGARQEGVKYGMRSVEHGFVEKNWVVLGRGDINGRMQAIEIVTLPVRTPRPRSRGRTPSPQFKPVFREH
jgi:hypothetical protein